MANILKATDEGPTDRKTGKPELKGGYTPAERIFKGIGAQPAREAEFWRQNTLKQSRATAKKDVSRFFTNPANDIAEARRQVLDYNRSAAPGDKVDILKLLKTRMNNAKKPHAKVGE
jgi:hypothetical protein